MRRWRCAAHRSQLTTPERKRQFVDNYILNELLSEQGRTKGYDRDPDIVRRHTEPAQPGRREGIVDEDGAPDLERREIALRERQAGGVDHCECVHPL